jgi:hypothetical protein
MKKLLKNYKKWCKYLDRKTSLWYMIFNLNAKFRFNLNSGFNRTAIMRLLIP